MTAFLIGLLLCYINTDSVLSLCDTVKTCYEATNGEMTFELGLKVHFLNNALLALGKVPGPEVESVFRKEKRFPRVAGSQRRSVMAELKMRGGRFCRSKVMQGDIFG